MSLCDIEIFKTAVVQKWGPIKLGQWLICHKEPLVNYNQRSNDLFEWYLDFPSFFLFGRDLRKSPPQLKKNSTKVTHPVKHVSDLPGLLLQVILPVHGVDDHQLTCTCGQSCWVENIKTLMSPSITTAYHILVEHIQTQVIHPIVSVLPGLLLQVVLAAHGVVEHQLSCT